MARNLFTIVTLRLFRASIGGATGSVVNLVALGSDAHYIIEKDLGFNIEVAENEIAEKDS